MSEQKNKRPSKPVRYQLKMLRSYSKIKAGEIAVFDEDKANMLLDDRKGGPFAEVVQVLED